LHSSKRSLGSVVSYDLKIATSVFPVRVAQTNLEQVSLKKIERKIGLKEEQIS
jgi:hypothetical protein